MKSGFLALSMIAALCMSVATHAGQVRIYQVIEVYENSDLNYPLIEEYIKTPTKWGERDHVLDLFRPITGGGHKIIFFRASFLGLGHESESEQKIFHDVLILKLDNKNTIMDGLQYTREWAEPPLSVDLYRVGEKGIKLVNQLNLSSLKFRPLIEADPKGSGEKISGVLDNLYGNEKLF